MKKINKIALIIVSLFVLVVVSLPMSASAQLDTVDHVVNSVPIASAPDLIKSIENLIALIFSAIAVVMFVVAGILFLTAQGDAEKLKEARSAVIWGIAGIVVGLIAFSIIAIVSTFLKPTVTAMCNNGVCSSNGVPCSGFPC